MDDKRINREELIAAARAQGIELAGDDIMNITDGDAITFFPGAEVVFVLYSDDKSGQFCTGTIIGIGFDNVHYVIKCHEDDHYYRVHCDLIIKRR